MRRRLLQIALALAAVYVAACAALFVAMRQPRVINGVMARMPMATFLVFPIRPLWMAARAGNLDAGDPAPDFSLQTVDRKSRVQLSSQRGQRPVVLIFGSYT